MSGSIETLNANVLLLIAAVEANTAALSGGAPAKTTTAKTTTNTKTAKTTEKPKSKFTKQEVCDVIASVKTTLGVPAAKALLADHGFAKLADITEDKFDALHEAGTALLGEPEENNDEDI